MKTANEWKQVWLDDKEPISNKTFEQRLTERIESIQLDAFNAGGFAAAEIAYNFFGDGSKQSVDCANAITTHFAQNKQLPV